MLKKGGKDIFSLKISLSLAVVLMNITVMFAKGFDMDKYLNQFVSADFVVGHTDYFNSKFRRIQQANGQPLDQRVDELRESCDENGLFPYSATFYGMEEFPMSKLEVTEGDLSVMQAGGDYTGIFCRFT